MKTRIGVALVLVVGGVAIAAPKLKRVTKDKVTIGVPAGYEVAIGEKCIAMEGRGSLFLIRTLISRKDFDKAEAVYKAKHVAKDKISCFEQTKPGENARCLVTTADGNWITQFVSFGKGYTAIGGSATMQAIVESVKGWDGKPYEDNYALGTDCPVVK